MIHGQHRQTVPSNVEYSVPQLRMLLGQGDTGSQCKYRGVEPIVALYSFLYGLPMAAGAMARPPKPARTIMVRR
jgi:hypothetical protein